MVQRKSEPRFPRGSSVFDELERLRSSAGLSDRFTLCLLAAVRILVRQKITKLGLPRAYVDDLAQDVLVETCRNPHHVREGDGPQFRAWIRGIAKHVAAHAARHDRRSRQTESSWQGVHRLKLPATTEADRPGFAEDQILDVAVDPLVIAIAAEERAEIARAIEQVPLRPRRVMARRVIDGESITAIALHLGVSRRTARRELTEAHDRLEALLRRSRSR